MITTISDISPYVHACLVASVVSDSLQSCSPPGSSVHGDSPGKNTGVGCHALLQGSFLTQGSKPHLLCLLGRSRFSEGCCGHS